MLPDKYLCILFTIFVLDLSPTVLSIQPVDEHDLCCFWASRAQCDDNPFWMRSHCQISCGTHYCNYYNATLCAVDIPERCGGDGSREEKVLQGSSMDDSSSTSTKPFAPITVLSPAYPPDRKTETKRPKDKPKELSLEEDAVARRKNFRENREQEAPSFPSKEGSWRNEEESGGEEIEEKTKEEFPVESSSLVSTDNELYQELFDNEYIANQDDLFKNFVKKENLTIEPEDDDITTSFEALLKTIGEIDINNIESAKAELSQLEGYISPVHGDNEADEEDDLSEEAWNDGFVRLGPIPQKREESESVEETSRAPVISNPNPSIGSRPNRTSKRGRGRTGKVPLSPLWSQVWPAWPFLRNQDKSSRR